jgi:hypothetical protein
MEYMSVMTTKSEALIEEMSDLIFEWHRQGKTFDETLLCLKDRYPREQGNHIGPALNMAIIKSFDVRDKPRQ